MSAPSEDHAVLAAAERLKKEEIPAGLGPQLRVLTDAIDCAVDQFEAHPERWTTQTLLDVDDKLVDYNARACAVRVFVGREVVAAEVAPLGSVCASCVIGMAIRCGLPAEYYHSYLAYPSHRRVDTKVNTSIINLVSSIVGFNDMCDSVEELIEAVKTRTEPFDKLLPRRDEV